MPGFLLGFLFMLVMTPLTIWFLVKAVRACFSKEVKEDFIRRPVFHTAWAIAGALCLHAVIHWITI